MIDIYNDGILVKKTSKAFNIEVTKELMRCYNANMSFLNTDEAVK